MSNARKIAGVVGLVALALASVLSEIEDYLADERERQAA